MMMLVRPSWDGFSCDDPTVILYPFNRGGRVAQDVKERYGAETIEFLFE